MLYARSQHVRALLLRRLCTYMSANSLRAPDLTLEILLPFLLSMHLEKARVGILASQALLKVRKINNFKALHFFNVPWDFLVTYL